jgi:hypothetical protein
VGSPYELKHLPISDHNTSLHESRGASRKQARRKVNFADNVTSVPFIDLPSDEETLAPPSTTSTSAVATITDTDTDIDDWDVWQQNTDSSPNDGPDNNCSPFSYPDDSWRFIRGAEHEGDGYNSDGDGSVFNLDDALNEEPPAKKSKPTTWTCQACNKSYNAAAQCCDAMRHVMDPNSEDDEDDKDEDEEEEDEEDEAAST